MVVTGDDGLYGAIAWNDVYAIGVEGKCACPGRGGIRIYPLVVMTGVVGEFGEGGFGFTFGDFGWDWGGESGFLLFSPLVWEALDDRV